MNGPKNIDLACLWQGKEAPCDIALGLRARQRERLLIHNREQSLQKDDSI
jgi:hypothetical protein